MKRKDHGPDLATSDFDFESWVDGLCASDPRLEREVLSVACHLVAALPNHGASLLVIGTQFAQLMAELRIDTSCLLAALVYRAVNGRHLPLEAVQTALGVDVAHLVLEVQKIGRVSVLELRSARMQEREARDQVENVRLMLVAMIDDVRVAVLKLAERIIALRLVKRAPASRQSRIAQEVLQVFVPLANRLGIWRLKWELEDLALRYESPDRYREIAAQLDGRRAEREDDVLRIAEVVRNLLAREGIRSEVKGRAKHIFSIARKMQTKDIPLDRVYDVRAVRVIVPSLKDCYAALGVIHTHWRHVPLEFDDYIANPKENGYRSIHTAVIGPDDRTLEIQIRTQEMHREAELGVCSHWVYKDGTGRREGLYGEKLEWLRQVLEWHEEVGGFMSVGRELQSAIEDDRIYVLTPGGHVLDMIAGATPVDFAYRIHTEIGHRCRAARVDGRPVPLDTALESGQRVEIVTGESAAPDRNWLNPQFGFVRTARARAKIQSWFRSRSRSGNIDAGRAILMRELARLGVAHDLPAVAVAGGYVDEDALAVAVAVGEAEIADVIGSFERSRGGQDAPARRRYVLQIGGEDRPGLLHDVTSVIADFDVTMSSLQAESDPQTNAATIRLALDLCGIEELARIVAGIDRVAGVTDVARVDWD